MLEESIKATEAAPAKSKDSDWVSPYTDFRRHRKMGMSGIHTLLITPGFWAIVGYRFLHAIDAAFRKTPLRPIANQFCIFSTAIISAWTQCLLPARAKIGPGLYILHSGPMMINDGVVIGSNCTMVRGVAIGHHMTSAGDSPVIGDRVFIGTGAILFGSIEVGHDSLIGAGAVLTRSVPPRSVVMGNPARVMGNTGSFHLVRYDGMETDPERLASLAQVPQQTDTQTSG
jgi:serine O-acetyltransferase